MDNYKKNPNNDIIEKTDHLLKDVEEYIGSVDEKTNEKNEAEIEVRTARSVREDLGVKDDGYAEIRTSLYELKAYADFYPSLGGGKPITIEDVTAPKTAVYCGVDFIVKRKLGWIKKKILSCSPDTKRSKTASNVRRKKIRSF